jgi:hypothetical protein
MDFKNSNKFNLSCHGIQTPFFKKKNVSFSQGKLRKAKGSITKCFSKKDIKAMHFPTSISSIALIASAACTQKLNQ